MILSSFVKCFEILAWRKLGIIFVVIVTDINAILEGESYCHVSTTADSMDYQAEKINSDKLLWLVVQSEFPKWLKASA